ncbi:major histocompatibility complex class I-related gene protein-like [Cheilinus undulatus]|uniref:major histocompatibility complex class I-related gene protein-like n=1 Tax=Cheilinus undulatus TaxID=241271 RepID=UPI001BD43513|nr:major histocompatibility complex class I-related gene protein-like [Cheilinus undulatus]
MKTVFVLISLLHLATSVKHSLEFLFTASRGLPNIPEFMATAQVDGFGAGYCDSNTKTAKSHDWTRELMREDPDHLKWYSEQCLGYQHLFKAHIVSIMQSLNQSGGVHVLQMMSGCVWNEETGGTFGFLKYGYDGEDFMALDLQASTWITLKPEAVTTKLNWDTDKGRLQFETTFCIHDCPNRLKKYALYGRESVLKTKVPSVELIQKSPSSPVTCFATGFYPDRAVMFWSKEKEQIYEGVHHGEILPNNDHTFQKSVDLNISTVKPEDRGKYYWCMFQCGITNKEIITKTSVRLSFGWHGLKDKFS